MFKTCSAIFAVAIVLAGCAERLVTEVATTQCDCADNYCMALKEGYLSRANSELAESDQKDAAFFARKAAAACRGELVLPQDPRQRKLHETLELDALNYRARLMQLISNRDGNREKDSGTILAAAQVSFDCWLQELEEGHQADDIIDCKKSLEEKLDALN